MVEAFHSDGSLPLDANTVLALRYGKSASGISTCGGTSEPRSKLWLPSVSALMPSMLRTSIVGLSPKKFEIGGDAPTASPPDSVMELPPSRPPMASARYASNHGFR